MGALVSLAAARQERTPHLSGEAKCIGCQHQWVAVAPIGAVMLDCPVCSLPKGRMVNPCLHEGSTWVCACGNDLFRISPTAGVYCTNCADVQEGWF